MSNYDEAFALNYGVLTRTEQERIKQARVAVLGLGGAGGTISIILARSGIENFNLIDFDRYSERNLNRQIGCFIDTIGEYKADVIKRDILRINPAACVEPFTKKLSFDELGRVMDGCDVFVAAADDLPYSSTALLMAQERKKFAITYMPSGLTGYILAFPPNRAVINPSDLFGAPSGLSCDDLRSFLNDPLHRCGRRWYVTQGRWRVSWFARWRVDPTVPMAQLCANVWLGAALASLEIVKYLSGKGQVARAPKMWHLLAADNRIQVEKFRARTWLFCKTIVPVFNIKWQGLGDKIRDYTQRRLAKELAAMQKQEDEGQKVKLPFIWRHVI